MSQKLVRLLWRVKATRRMDHGTKQFWFVEILVPTGALYRCLHIHPNQISAQVCMGRLWLMPWEVIGSWLQRHKQHYVTKSRDEWQFAPTSKRGG